MEPSLEARTEQVPVVRRKPLPIYQPLWCPQYGGLPWHDGSPKQIITPLGIEWYRPGQ